MAYLKNCAGLLLALKKNVAFPDDLVRRLNGKLLLDYSLELLEKTLGKKNCWVVTDSEEIKVFCQRKKFDVIFDPSLSMDKPETFSVVHAHFKKMSGTKAICLLWPYAPTLSLNDLRAAINQHIKEESIYTISVSEEKQNDFEPFGTDWKSAYNPEDSFSHKRVRGFLITSPKNLFRNPSRKRFTPFVVADETHEIKGFSDWWVCEGLLRRKRIVFRIIGNPQIGMGHIYRALTLAHEINDHEIIFLCTEDEKLAVSKIAGRDYRIESVRRASLVKRIRELKPALVVNDCLNTSSKYVSALAKSNIKTLNFEDFGLGSKLADVVINELYDVPLSKGKNVRWGKDYMFLREEFFSSQSNLWRKKVNRILVTFGGCDPRNLTFRILQRILPWCRERSLAVRVVVGTGYQHLQVLNELIGEFSDIVSFTNSTGVISDLMEDCQVAICGNGRTVYELSHMRIPAIVVSHHERELSHKFACAKNGFVRMGTLDRDNALNNLSKHFKKLCINEKFRKNLWEKSSQHDFINNKQRVLKLIYDLL
jgi:spore coat polysaccharide biosynthesis predicted glycosyltransferase SpsG